MKRLEYIQPIEISGRVEEIHDNLIRINEMIENRSIQELIYKEIVLLEDVVRDILLVGQL